MILPEKESACDVLSRRMAVARLRLRRERLEAAQIAAAEAAAQLESEEKMRDALLLICVYAAHWLARSRSQRARSAALASALASPAVQQARGRFAPRQLKRGETAPSLMRGNISDI